MWPLSARLMRAWQSLSRPLLAVFYLAAGIVHLAAPTSFLPIMPTWVPFPVMMILITGLCEMAGAIGLYVPRLRWWAAVLLAVYAICVFPANIRHAFEGITVAGLPTSWWYHAPRLALQPWLVWWAWSCRNDGTQTGKT
jgi:uncharacterized membrane protein